LASEDAVAFMYDAASGRLVAAPQRSAWRSPSESLLELEL
jgi:hypothetical protein